MSPARGTGESVLDSEPCTNAELSWFDAHMWAYAEVFGLAELITEDFQSRRLYGSVRIVDPFA